MNKIIPFWLILFSSLVIPHNIYAQEITNIQMQERVCERVNRRFSDNPKMYMRVNDRIEKRFGFQCQRNNQVPTNEDQNMYMKAVKYQLSHPRAEVNIPKSDSSHLQSIVYKKLMHMYELSETDLNKINSDMNIWPNSVQASIKDAIRLWPFYKNKLMQLSEKGKDGDIKNSDIRAGLLYSKKVTDMMNEVSQILEDYTQGILN